MSSNQPSFVVVAGLDVSPQALDVLNTALASARGQPGASLHIVHVVEAGVYGVPQLVDEARGLLESMAMKATASLERVHTHLCLGTPWREILQVATNTQADLVVVGTHGRGAVGRLLLGSQSELVVRRASCQVLVVRAKSYEDANVPGIEPPCSDCVTVQSQSAGTQLWCGRHAKVHPAPHRHYEYPQSFGLGSQLVRP